MSPERIARLRAFAAAFEGTPLGDPIVELLLENENLSTERERLVAENERLTAEVTRHALGRDAAHGGAS